MPAIIAHHLFGEDAASLLPDGIISSQEDLLAFLLGSQGTDPFWARVTASPKTAKECHQFAYKTHTEHMGMALIALRNCVNRLNKDDRSIGRAFTLGMAAHYMLDSMAHPLIYSLQEGIVAADHTLVEARGEIHAIIEADIDSWLLWEKRNKTVLDTPCTLALARTARIDRIVGAMLSQVAWEVFDLQIGASEYGLAMQNYQLLYRLIDPPAQRTLGALSKAELLFRPHSRLLAQSHRVITKDKCSFANLEHRSWKNPSTGEVSVASFADLFHDALIAWPVFSKRLVEGDQDRLNAMIDNVDYNGWRH